MRPGEYKNGGTGRTILFTIAKCSLGFVLVGGTDDGICSVSMGNSEDELRRNLKLEFPRATLLEDRQKLSAYVNQILCYIDGSMEADLTSIPVDVRATAFQQRVWMELKRIPFGSTKTYSEIAEGIGSPSAARAVANACASNPVALILPCHRVLRKDGSIGGYRWGLGRKEALLAKESERAQSS